MLGALRLAAIDEAKGTIDEARIDRMTETIMAVIGDLDSHVAAVNANDAETPSITIACVAGRGPFDDAVSTMLTQILACRGITARVIKHQAAARGAIADLDLTGIDTIALSYLELEGSPAHLRFLIRRLRQKAPSARIIVGLWPEGEAILSDASIQTMLGADKYVSSLRQASATIDHDRDTTPKLAARSTS